MFKVEDIELPKDTLDTLKVSDPTLLDFIVKAVTAMRGNETIRIACFSSDDLSRSLLKYLLYKLGFRRDVEFLDYLANPQTKLHQQVREFLDDEYEMCKKDYEMMLASDWISSGSEKSAAAKVLSVLKKDTWGDKPTTIQNMAPTQIVFGEKVAKPTPQQQVGWQGVDNFVKENGI